MNKLRQWKKTILVVLIFAVICVVIHLYGFHIVIIHGTSMEATLQSGEIVFVTKFDYLFGNDPERGDIVECRFEGRSDAYIKRVIGLPGETVEITDGRVYIDGAALSEPYVSSPNADYSICLGEDQYLLLGDNRMESYDSRAEDMGLLSRDDFIGKVRFVIYPFRSIN